MSRFAIYDSAALQLLIATIPITEGRDKSSFLKLTPQDEHWGVVQDTNGLVTRFRKNNRLWTMEVSLHQSSVHHSQFQAIFGADHLATDGTGVTDGLIKDNNGSTLATFPHMWVTKQPDAEWGEEVKTWTWTFTCVSDGHVVMLGGN